MKGPNSKWGALARVDTRSLAAVRIAIAIVLLYDLLARWPHVDLIYTNAGIFPDHFDLFVDSKPRISLMFGLSTKAHANTFFLVSALAYFSLLVGWRARLALFSSWLCTVSIHLRAPLAMYGGDLILHCFMLWLLFLPVGERWSVDALLRARSSRSSVSSVAVLGLTLQLSAIYLYNALNKTGSTWEELSAVHHSLWQDSIVRPVGLWARGLPAWSLEASAAGTIGVELAAAIGLWIPWRRGWVLAAVLVGAGLLHFGIWLTMDVGNFAATMWSVYLVFVTASGWDRLSRFAATRGWTSLSRSLGAPTAPFEPRADAIGRWEVRIRESVAAYFFVSATLCIVGRNGGTPEPLRFAVPTWASVPWDAIGVPQGWGLFAPDAPESDGWFVIDAVTVNGEHIDPLTGEAPLREIPVGYGEGRSHIPFAWTRQIRHGQWMVHRPSLDGFVWGAHLHPYTKVGAPIAAYRAYNLVRDNPPIGGSTPGPWRLIPLYESHNPGLAATQGAAP